MPRAGYAEVIGAAVGGAANAGWFGDGRDGDLIVEAGQTYMFDVALDEGQVVKQFRNVYIGEGATVKTSGRCNGMVWMVQGDFENRGTITMDKCAPLLNDKEALCAQQKHVKLCNLKGGNAGAAGNGGQKSSSSNSWSAYRAGGTPGIGFAFGGGYGPGSGNGNAAGGNAEPRPPIGTAIPFPAPSAEGVQPSYGAGASAGYSGSNTASGESVFARGGNGPGGSSAVGVYYSSGVVTAGNNGDAVGGGAIWIFVQGKVTISATGLITACGGNGGAGVSKGKRGEGGASGSVTGASGGGGAAGGGIIAIVHTGDYENSGAIKANGGIGGARPNVESTNQVTAGSDGEAGPVLITTLDALLAS